MTGYRLTTEARDELVAGVTFYESQYPGLGRDFAIEVRRLCRLIVESPAAGLEIRPTIRRRIVRRFPYSVLYATEDDEVVILAVAHQSRRPGYWQRRE